MSHPGGIPQLTGLRGIAALWVFAMHVSVIARHTDLHDVLRIFGAAGHLGVDVFFVLSGFVLAFNYGDRQLHRSIARWGAFLWKRLARIYPLHLAALALVPIAMLAMMAIDVPFARLEVLSAGGLLHNLALTHAWSMPIERTWNVPSWSISAEWAAYLAFPMVAALAQRACSPLVLKVLVGALLIALWAVLQFGEYGGAMAYGMPRIAAEFSVGVLLHRLWVLQGRPCSPSWDRLTTAVLILLVAGGNLVSIFVWSRAPILYGPMLACLLIYGLARSAGPLARMLAQPAWLYAGAVSYAFYLVHWTVISCARSVLMEFALHEDAMAVAIAVGVTALVAAALAHWLYRSIERPARTAMLGWAAPRPRPPLPAQSGA